MLFRIKWVLRLVLASLFVVIVIWQSSIIQLKQEKSKGELQIALQEIKKEIEENATCYTLYKEVELNEDEKFVLIHLRKDGQSDTVQNYTAVLGEHSRNFEGKPLKFETTTKMDLSIRVEYLMSNSDTPSEFQQWVDSSNATSLIDSETGISLGDSNQLKKNICNMLDFTNCSWSILNGSGIPILSVGKNDLSETDTLQLFEKRILGKTSPFLLIVKAPSASIISLLIQSWEIWIAVFIIGLSMLLLYLQEKNLQLEKRNVDYQRNLLNHISHEFNTQITKISLAAESLPLSENDEEHRSYLAIIQKGSKQLGVNLKSLLKGSNTSINAFSNSKEKFDLDLPLCTSSERFQKEGKRIQIDCPKRLSIIGDRTHIEQVFDNLFQNFEKYGGDTCLVNVQNRNAYIQLTFSDNGNGVTAKQLSRITKPWERANTKTIEGFGLGLSYSKSVIEQHRGSLVVENNKEQSGLCVTIKLPVS